MQGKERSMFSDLTHRTNKTTIVLLLLTFPQAQFRESDKEREHLTSALSKVKKRKKREKKKLAIAVWVVS